MLSLQNDAQKNGSGESLTNGKRQTGQDTISEINFCYNSLVTIDEDDTLPFLL
jgi:hypothetical protein